jgi:hypothetical protein
LFRGGTLDIGFGGADRITTYEHEVLFSFVIAFSFLAPSQSVGYSSALFPALQKVLGVHDPSPCLIQHASAVYGLTCCFFRSRYSVDMSAGGETPFVACV